jgi:hypothetical protein
VLVEPGPRLLDRVAILDAVHGDRHLMSLARGASALNIA